MTRTPVMSVADEARGVARELIPLHHPHLVEADILYVFTDQKRKRCDRVRLGSAAKLSSLQRFLASGLDGVDQGPDFVMLIDSTLWGQLSKTARQALVDHELCHMAMFVTNGQNQWRRIESDEIKEDFNDWRWGLRAHDVEEFGEVLYRWGWWKPDAPERKFSEIVAMQLKIPETKGHALPESDGATVDGTSRSRKRASRA